MPDFAAYDSPQSIGRRHFCVVSAIVDRRQNRKQSLVVVDGYWIILCQQRLRDERQSRKNKNKGGSGLEDRRSFRSKLRDRSRFESRFEDCSSHRFRLKDSFRLKGGNQAKTSAKMDWEVGL